MEKTLTGQKQNINIQENTYLRTLTILLAGVTVFEYMIGYVLVENIMKLFYILYILDKQVGWPIFIAI